MTVTGFQSKHTATLEINCAAEPWFRFGRFQLQSPIVGNVPEKLLALAHAADDLGQDSASLRRAAGEAEAIYRRQISEELNVDEVEALCDAEPWCDRSLSKITSARFGRVPEKFTEAARRFAHHPDQSAGFSRAAAEAYHLYHEQMKKSAIDFVRSDNGSDTDMRLLLWRMVKPIYPTEIEPDLERTDLGARLLWMALVIGDIYRGLVPSLNADGTFAAPRQQSGETPVARRVPAPLETNPINTDETVKQSNGLVRAFLQPNISKKPQTLFNMPKDGERLHPARKSAPQTPRVLKLPQLNAPQSPLV